MVAKAIPRSLEKVINKILEVIPLEERNAGIIADLRLVLLDVGYRPPETHWMSWRMGSQVLSRYIGHPPNTDWGKRVQRIWNGEESHL